MKILLLTTALLLSSTLHAGIYAGFGDVANNDLYRGDADTSMTPTAVQPGIGSGSKALEAGFVSRAAVKRQGTNDAYGSILLDVGHDLDW